jgi:hypothetical protein
MCDTKCTEWRNKTFVQFEGAVGAYRFYMGVWYLGKSINRCINKCCSSRCVDRQETNRPKYNSRNVSDKSCRENQNTHFMFNNFFRKSCCLWDNVEKYGRARQATDDNIIRRMRFACWVTKATDTHWEYVILIAFALQQRSRERAWMLRYTHIACVPEPSDVL